MDREMILEVLIILFAKTIVVKARIFNEIQYFSNLHFVGHGQKRRQFARKISTYFFVIFSFSAPGKKIKRSFLA